ncbi:MAG: iron donor protein CyaY [Casimicrobiaceae bacterium]
MNRPEFNFDSEVERIFSVVIDTIDAADCDCDCEQAEATLTLTWPDGRTVVLSRHAVNQEIWIAAREGGFHFRHDAASGAGWVDTRTGEPLAQVLSRVCAGPIGRPIEFRL